MLTPNPDSAFATEKTPALRFLIPLTVAFAFTMEQLDSTIITTAIPDIAEGLHTSPLQMNLAITSYILSLAVFIPVSGWFADKYGARRVFIAALLVFTAASGLCGLSQTLPQMVATRILQGFGGAMMTPVGRLILIRAFPRSQLVTAMTYMTVPAVIGPTMGPLLGGFLTTYAGWRWLFYVNIPLGLLGIALALRYLENTRVEAAPRFDLPGFLLCGAGLACLQFALEAIGHPILPHAATPALFIAAVLLLAAYAWYSRRRTDPALDLTLFRDRVFRTSTLVGGLSRTGANAVPFMLPLMLQLGFGYSPIQSGSITFVVSLGTLAVRPVSAILLRAFGFRGVLAGNGIICAAIIAAFALTTASTPHWLLIVHLLTFGVVRGTQFMTTNTLTYAEIPAPRLSRATSLGGVIQQLTISFGVSAAAALLALLAGPELLPSVANFHLAFLIMAGVTLLSVPGFLLLNRTDGAQVTGQRPRVPPFPKPPGAAGR